MVLVGLDLPAPFDFENSYDWHTLKRRFDQLHIASGLATDDGSEQTSTLFYTLGEEMESVQNSLNVTDEERKDYDPVYLKISTAFVMYSECYIPTSEV